MGNCLGLQLSYPHTQARQKSSLLTLNQGFTPIILYLVLSPVAAPCPGLQTSWKWLVHELLASIPWDSLTAANLIAIHSKSISARCSLSARAGQIAAAQHARCQVVRSAVRDLIGNVCAVVSECSTWVKQCWHNIATLYMEIKADRPALPMWGSWN